MVNLLAYGGLFAAAFLAATLLPLQSEALLTGLLIAGNQPVGMLVLAASAGNVMGSVVNWWAGRYVERFSGRKWFPVKAETLQRAEKWYRHYGRWTLLLSWVPVIGDPLTVIAGILKEPLWSFLMFVGVAKPVRYIAIAAALLKMEWIG